MYFCNNVCVKFNFLFFLFIHYQLTIELFTQYIKNPDPSRRGFITSLLLSTKHYLNNSGGHVKTTYRVAITLIKPMGDALS